LEKLFNWSIAVKLSRYFQELNTVYKSELDDLRTDSEGKDVMRKRLKEKRDLLPYLLPMMEENPEMLATAFHGAFIFINPLAMEAVITKEANKLPSWASLAKAVKLEPWAEQLKDIVETEPEGDALMVTAACLEYLLRGQSSNAKANTANSSNEEEEDDGSESDGELHENGDLDGNYGRHGRDDGDDGDDVDLEEAGAEWLAEQGFDRKE
jgi:hypothetical protein